MTIEKQIRVRDSNFLFEKLLFNMFSVMACLNSAVMPSYDKKQNKSRVPDLRVLTFEYILG